MVYVDDCYKYKSISKFKKYFMSHLIADTSEELIAFAKKIGLNEKHIQEKGTWKEHFDVSQRKRDKAIKAGAYEIKYRDIITIMKTKDIK